MKSAKAVKRLRSVLGLHQDQFAKLLRMTGSAVSHWECGLRKPRWPQIRAMVQIAKKHSVDIKFEDFGE